MYYLYPIFYAVNGYSIHRLLLKYSEPYKNHDPSVRHEIIGRWNNAFTQIPLAIYTLCCNPTPESLERMNILFTLYFFSDMVHMLMYCYDWVFYVHHLIPLLVYSTLWDTLSLDAKSGLVFTAGVLELTTPPISLVWVLSKLHLKGWYTSYATAFAYLNFLTIRILYFPYFWYNDLPFIIQCLAFPYHFMNIFWFGKMTSYVLKTNQ